MLRHAWASLPTFELLQGFFGSGVSVESLRTTGVAVSYLADKSLDNPCVVAPNEACVELAHDFRVCSSAIEPYFLVLSFVSQEGLRRAFRKKGLPARHSEVNLALLVEKGPSRGTDRYLHAQSGSNRERSIDLMGEVEVSAQCSMKEMELQLMFSRQLEGKRCYHCG